MFKKTTTRYFANSASLKRDVSSELTTVKPCSFPRARIAAIPAGIESCRNPAVFVNTRMLNRLASAAGRAAADATNIHTAIAVHSHMRLRNFSLIGRTERINQSIFKRSAILLQVLAEVGPRNENDRIPM